MQPNEPNESRKRAATRKVVSIIGIGCSLFCDQGFGGAIVQVLNASYVFPDHVHLVDGAMVGVGLTGLIGRSEHVIAMDAFRNGGLAGDCYRLEGDRIFERFKMKNHVQHVHFLEAVAHCQALDVAPKAVLLGIEPQDTTTVVCALTPVLQNRKATFIKLVLAELDRLGVTYAVKDKDLSCV